MEYSNEYMALMGMAPKRIPHGDPWSCPDAETYITGIDYYEHPKLCREKMREMYPFVNLGIPDSDDPVTRPEMDLDGKSSNPEKHTVRWGTGETATWEHGEKYFKTAEDVFNFSPLEKGDFSDWPHVVDAGDFSSEEIIYENLRKGQPEEWGDCAPEGSTAGSGMYNTMFMWPLLVFGWDLFLECCLNPRFEPVMDEFAEINRRRFKAMARLPINFVGCHDDIVNNRGLICSPAWMHKYIYPRYEEFWGIVKAAGKEVTFMTDGNADPVADEVFACGALGITTEPATDFKAIARNHENCYLVGEGDNRILSRNDPDEIDAMVRSMIETAHMTGGYVMSIGNHIPWNVTPEGIKRYLDRSAEWGHR